MRGHVQIWWPARSISIANFSGCCSHLGDDGYQGTLHSWIAVNEAKTLSSALSARPRGQIHAPARPTLRRLSHVGLAEAERGT